LVFGAFGVLWSSLALGLGTAPLAMSQTAIGMFGLAGVAGVVGASRAGRLADRGWGQWTSGAALALMLLAWWAISRNEPPLWSLVVGVAALDLGGQAVHVISQSMLFRALPHARNRIVAAYMLFYSLGTGGGALASTAAFAWGGWRGVCQLGAAISGLALLFWAITLRDPHQARFDQIR
jgi:predicted MFS family arabinose efflux permease